MNIFWKTFRLIIIVALLSCLGTGENVVAQNQNNEKLIKDTTRLKQQEKAIESIKGYQSIKNIGIEALINKAREAKDKVENKHEWAKGREPQDSKKDWVADSIPASINAKDAVGGGADPRSIASYDYQYGVAGEGSVGGDDDPFVDTRDKLADTFFECFEPRIIENKCEYCIHSTSTVYPDSENCTPRPNLGEKWEFWWPEFEIEINAFGISAFSIQKTRPEFSYQQLREACQESIKAGLSDDIKEVIKHPGMGKELTGGDNSIAKRYDEEMKKLQDKIKDLCGGTGIGASIPEGEAGEAHIYRPQGTYTQQTTQPERHSKNFDGYEFPVKPSPYYTGYYNTPTPYGGWCPETSPVGHGGELVPEESRKCCAYDFIWNGWQIVNKRLDGNSVDPIDPTLDQYSENVMKHAPWYNKFCFYDTFPLADEDKPTKQNGHPHDGPHVVLGYTEEDGSGGETIATGGINPHQIWKFPLLARKFGKDEINDDYGGYMKQKDLDGLKLSLDAQAIVKKLAELDDFFAIGGGPGFGGTKKKVDEKKYVTQVGEIADLFGGEQSATTAPVSAAIKARKAIELFAEIAEKQRPRSKNDIMKRMFKYTDTVDKLQFVYPYGSKCFRTASKAQQQSQGSGMRILPSLNEKNQGKTGDIEGDIFKSEKFNLRQKGSVRLMFWNKRTACTCPWKSNQADKERSGGPVWQQTGWGCQPWRGEDGKSEYSVGDGDGEPGGKDDKVKGTQQIDNRDQLKGALPFI